MQSCITKGSNEMKKLMLTAAILAGAATAAHAYDAAYEAALVIFYDATCAKLPANFVKAKIKEGAGLDMKEERDGVQDDYKRNPGEFCADQQRNIKCMLDFYHTKKTRSC
jgi:hypothetical protein